MRLPHLFKKRSSKARKVKEMEDDVYYLYNEVKHLLPKYGLFNQPMIVGRIYSYGEIFQNDSLFCLLHDALGSIKMKDGSTLQDHVSLDDLKIRFEDYKLVLHNGYLYVVSIGMIEVHPENLPYWLEFRFTSENECDDRISMPESYPAFQIPYTIIHYNEGPERFAVDYHQFSWDTFDGPSMDVLSRYMR